MNAYNPQIAPNREQWLESSEFDRIDAVREFHDTDEDNDLEDNALSIHSSIHVIVENQLAMEIELLPETLAKLMRQGLDRHDAIHAIGAIISDDIFSIISGEKTEFSPKEYRGKLAKITAKRWRKGQY